MPSDRMSAIIKRKVRILNLRRIHFDITEGGGNYITLNANERSHIGQSCFSWLVARYHRLPRGDSIVTRFEGRAVGGCIAFLHNGVRRTHG